MKAPNWRESNPELKAAWFEFKSKYTGAGTPCLSSFAAGWNTQKPLAHREGWEQAKREALEWMIQNHCINERMANDFCTKFKLEG